MKFNRKTLSFILVSTLIAFSFSGYTTFNGTTSGAETGEGDNLRAASSISPISIDGNDELATHPKVSGSGTWDEPFMIEGYEITGSGSGIGINITNTNKPLIIQNCTITDFDSSNGIYMNNVSNAVVNNNIVFNNLYGIALKNSYNNSIISNRASENARAIDLDDSENNTVNFNNVFNNTNFGIVLAASSNNNTLKGNIVRETNTQPAIKLDNSCNNTLLGNIIDSNHHEGIAVLFDSDENVLINNTVKNSDGIGIDLFWEANNNELYNNTIENNDEKGINFNEAHNNTLIGNSAINNSMDGLYLEKSDNNTLERNTAINNSEDGIHLLFSSNNKVINNTASNNRDDGLELLGANNNTVTFNTLFNNSGVGIFLNLANDTRIVRNSALNNSLHGIFLFGSYRNTLNNNNASLSGDDGIGLAASKNNTLKNNTASRNKDDGISLISSESNILFQNNMISCGIWTNDDLNGLLTLSIDQSNTVNGKPVYYYKSQTGLAPSDFSNAGQIILVNSNDSIISGVDASDGSQGISLFYSNNNSVRESTLLSNNWMGAYFYYSNNNSFKDTTITNNLYGIHLHNSSGNRFVKNFFIENGINGMDNGTGNQWDNGTVGNYWSDYLGSDSDDDGIGDSPYNVPGSANAQDNYPIYDDSAPAITIHNPVPNVFYGKDAPNLSVNVDDPWLESMWYALNGGGDIYFTTNGTLNETLWNLLPDGEITLKISASDHMNHISSENISLKKDTAKPQIDINSPSQGDTIRGQAPTFNVEISDTWLNTTWYTLNDSQNIIFTSNGTINQTLWDLLPYGEVGISFYANDSAGHISSVNITITKERLSRPGEEIPSYPLGIILPITSLAVIGLILVYQKKSMFKNF